MIVIIAIKIVFIYVYIFIVAPGSSLTDYYEKPLSNINISSEKKSSDVDELHDKLSNKSHEKSEQDGLLHSVVLNSYIMIHIIKLFVYT